MKNNSKIIIIAMALVVALLGIVLAVTPKKTETGNDYYPMPINSGEIIRQEVIKKVSGEEPAIMSGEVLGVSDISSDLPEDKKDAVDSSANYVTENITTTPTPKPTPKPTTKPLTSNTPYYIKINNQQNVVNIYQKDAEGNYTVPYKAMICSTGIDTPEAGSRYKVTTYKNRWNGLQGNVYGQYATQIIGNILFHSVPYTARSASSLEYWEYDKLGTAASLGCVRLTVEDAKWIYDNISAGTIVEFYEDENPGPLGKPVAQKISDNEFCRDWDPTDLAEGNPWNIPSVVEQHEVTEMIEKEVERWEEEQQDITTTNLFSGEQEEEKDNLLENVAEEVSGESKEKENVPEWLRVGR